MNSAKSTGVQSISCPLCSIDFSPVGNCHNGCPMASSCSLIRCPQCSYEFPDPSRSRLASFLTRLLKRDG